MTSTRKTILTTAIIGAITLAGLQSASAYPGAKGPGNCGNCPQQGGQLDEATQQAKTKFLDETVALRKLMTVKQTEMRAIMNSEAPDASRAAALSGELFEIREQLRTKAQENGLPGHGLMGEMGMHNCGTMGKNRPHHGRMQ